MQGFKEKTDSNTVFLTVKHNSLCQESKTEREGFRPVEVKNPQTGEMVTKHIKQYEAVEGYVTKIEWYDSQDKYEKRFQSWKIHLNVSGTPAILDLPFDSRVSSRFMKLAENLDFSEPIEFSAWHDAKSDSTAFNVKQLGQSVPQVYTRDNPGECPAPTQNKLGKWNFDAQKEFLYERMMNVVIPAVEAAGNEMPEASQAASATASTAHIQDDLADDDIPF